MAFPSLVTARRFLITSLALTFATLAPSPAQGQTCTTIVPPCPPNTAPTVVISPTVNPDTMSSTVAVTVTITDDQRMNSVPSPNVTPSGWSGTWTASRTQAAYTGTLTLSNGWNTFSVSMTDDNSVTGSASVSLYYHDPGSPSGPTAPTLAMTPYSSTVRSLAGCSGCLYGGASYSTPAYVSRDIPRSVSLVYSSAMAVPRGFVQADAFLNTSSAPTNLSVRIAQSGSNITLTNGGTSAWYTGATGTTRVAAQFDASGLATGAHQYTLGVTAYWSGTPYETAVPIRVLVIRETGSVFGAGWSVAGLQRMHFASDSVAITDGSGGITFYRRTSSTDFAAENGAIDALTTNGSTYTLTSSDGGWVRFNSSGLMIASGGRYTADSTVYAYYDPSHFSSITDEAGQVTVFTYAPDAICPSGATSGTLCAITTPGGRVSKFVVNGSGDLVSIIDPDNATAFSGSYSSHKLTSATDRLGATTSLSYDSFTGLASVTAPSVTTTTTGGSTTSESPVTTYRSIEATLLSTSNTSSGSARAHVRWDTAYAYVTAPNGTASRMLLIGSGEPAFSQTVPLSGPTQSTTIAYNANYLPVSVTTAPVGGTVAYAWGGRDTLKSVTDPTGATTKYHYSAYFLDVDSVAVNGVTVLKNTWSTFSGTRNLWKSKYGSAETVYDWDSHGRPTQITTGGSVTTMRYHGSGFQNRDSLGTGSSQYALKWWYVHDAFGRDSLVRPPNYWEDPTIKTYDVMNRVTSVTQAGSAVTSISVSENTSAHTATATVTDPRSLVFSSVSNALGWGTTSTDPQSYSSTAGYDRNGLLRRAVNRVGGVVTASYDSLGRPVSITANGNTTSFSYDAITTPSATSWAVAANADSRDSVTSDGLGRPTSAHAIRSGATAVVTNAYNLLGDRRFMKITTGGGADSLVFGTDSVHFPYQVPDFGAGYSNITYTTTRQLQYIAFANGMQLYRAKFNAFQRPETLLVYAGWSGEQRVYSYTNLGRVYTAQRGDVNRDFTTRSYAYDGRGRVSRYIDTRYFVSDSLQEDCDPEEWCDPDRPWDYIWDSQTVHDVSFSPDLSGNRTDGSASLSNDRLSSMTGTDGVSYSFTYDNQGRRTAKTASGYSQTYGWNDLGQLIWVKTNSDSVAYGYDAAGRRARKYASGGTTYFIWDGDNLVMETNSSGIPIRKYAYRGLDTPIAITTGGNTYHYALDEEGNVIGLWDNGLSRVAEYVFDPFGYEISGSASLAQPLRWKGREFDSESGLYYMRARYYDPTVGRFISEDPIGLAGGINPYTFGDGDPVNRADPSGLEWICSDKHVEGTSKLADHENCTYQLDPMMVIASYEYIGFKSSRGGGMDGGSQWGGGGRGGSTSSLKEKLLEDMREMALNMPISGMTRSLPAVAGWRVLFQKGHARRHLLEKGLGNLIPETEARIQALILDQTRGVSTVGSFWGDVLVEGQRIQFRAFNIGRGLINVGTYYPW